MSQISTEFINCPNCNESQECNIYNSIRVCDEPELKDKLLNDEINVFLCENCKETFRVVGLTFVYNDSKSQIWFQYFYSEKEYLSRKKMLDTMAKKWDFKISVFFNFDELREAVSQLPLTTDKHIDNTQNNTQDFFKF